MSQEFLNEVVELTKKSRADKSVSYHGGGGPSLPHQSHPIYGHDAGVDYATSVFKDIREIILEAAKEKKSSVHLHMPPGGIAAQKAMTDTLHELLPGFDVAKNSGSASISWGKYFNE